jgi:repressor LexA
MCCYTLTKVIWQKPLKTHLTICLNIQYCTSNQFLKEFTLITAAIKAIATAAEAVKPTKLTSRQQDVLTLVRRGIQETGFPPTRAEIAASLGLKSANSAEEHLRALERKQVIELIAGSSRGIRLKPAYQTQTSSAQTDNAVMMAKNWLGLTLPLIGRVAAGSPILASEHVEAQYPVSSDLFSKQPDYLLRVVGQSMKDVGIMDGDLLAVKTSNTAQNGQIVVARVGDEVTVKRYMRHPDYIELLPENANFRPIIVTEHSGEFAIEGLAVGLMRTGF